MRDSASQLLPICLPTSHLRIQQSLQLRGVPHLYFRLFRQCLPVLDDGCESGVVGGGEFEQVLLVVGVVGSEGFQHAVLHSDDLVESARFGVESCHDFAQLLTAVHVLTDAQVLGLLELRPQQSLLRFSLLCSFALQDLYLLFGTGLQLRVSLACLLLSLLRLVLLVCTLLLTSYKFLPILVALTLQLLIMHPRSLQVSPERFLPLLTVAQLPLQLLNPALEHLLLRLPELGFLLLGLDHGCQFGAEALLYFPESEFVLGLGVGQHAAIHGELLREGGLDAVPLLLHLRQPFLHEVVHGLELPQSGAALLGLPQGSGFAEEGVVCQLGRGVGQFRPGSLPVLVWGEGQAGGGDVLTHARLQQLLHLLSIKYIQATSSLPQNGLAVGGGQLVETLHVSAPPLTEGFVLLAEGLGRRGRKFGEFAAGPRPQIADAGPVELEKSGFGEKLALSSIARSHPLAHGRIDVILPVRLSQLQLQVVVGVVDHIPHYELKPTRYFLTIPLLFFLPFSILHTLLMAATRQFVQRGVLGQREVAGDWGRGKRGFAT